MTTIEQIKTALKTHIAEAEAFECAAIKAERENFWWCTAGHNLESIRLEWHNLTTK